MGESRTTEAVMSGALFREIHKNAWLKRLAAPDNKKSGVLSKKGERVWVVFCVHDDSEAFLEGYSNTKIAATHVPDWFVCLNTTLHISPSICPRQHEYEFVITLSQDVIRLTAPTWESMQEWVEALRGKLREMRILSPNENVYSRMPEAKPLLLPTRDPTSPLPAPPPVPAILVPGVETIANVPAISTRTQTDTSINNESISISYGNVVLSTDQNYIHTIITTSADTENDSENTRLLSNDSDINLEADEERSAVLMSLDEISQPSLLINNLNEQIHDESKSISINPTIMKTPSFKQMSNQNSSMHNITVLSTPGSSANPVSFSTGSNSLVIVDSNMNNNQDVANNLDLLNDDNLLKDCDPSAPEESKEICDNDVQLSLKNMTSLFVTDSTKSNRTLSSSEYTHGKKHFKEQPIKESAAHGQNSTMNIGNSNITIIQVSNPPHSAIPVTSKHGVFSFNFQTDEDTLDNQPLFVNNSYDNSDNVLSLQNNTVDILESIAHSKPDSNIISSSVNITTTSHNPATSNSGLNLDLIQTVEENESVESSSSLSKNVSIKNNIERDNVNASITSGNNLMLTHYEKIFLPSTSNSVTSIPVNIATRIPPKSPKFSLLSKQQRSISHSELQINRTRIHGNAGQNSNHRINAKNDQDTSGNITNINISKRRNLAQKFNSPVNRNESPEISSAIPIRHILMRGFTELQITRSRQQERSHNSDVNESMAENIQPNSVVVSVQNTSVTGENRRRSLSSSETSRNVCTSRNIPEQSNSSPLRAPTVNSVARLTLREQQVLQLRQEMGHPGGVRLTLRRKDCVGSIALVDAIGVVWIAGWKQRQHPMLYNALHIGDHLMSVAGVPVTSANEATKVIRAVAGLYVEFIIRRVPYGRVYAIRKETDGQCLGIIQDSNTATIVDIVPNSLAARHGIPPRAQTCDGLSLTSWVLTEINGRPLNLFFKDDEVRDRLNALGRDISILIQPLDLVKQLKKQLKSLRSYKDYIVQ